MKMKKVAAVIVAVSMTLCSCGNTTVQKTSDSSNAANQAGEETVVPTEEPQISDSEIISSFYDAMYTVRKNIVSGDYVSVSEEVEKLQNPTKAFADRINSNPKECADYFEKINSSQYFQHMCQEYYNKGQNYDEDKNEAKSHALILKTYLDLLLKEELPFDYDKNKEIIKEMSHKEDDSKLREEYGELITAYHRLGWNEKLDDNESWDFYLPEDDMKGVNSFSANPKIGLAKENDQRTMSIYIYKAESTSVGRGAKSITFKSDGKKIVIKNKNLQNLYSDIITYVEAVVYDSNEGRKYNQMYGKLKTLFAQGKQVSVFINKKKIKVYNEKEVKQMQKYFLLFDILVDKYI